MTQAASVGPSTLDAIFAPKGVALIGATEDATRAGGRIVAYMTDNGYAGRIHYVNPTRSTIRGRPCYPSIREVPEPVDLALIVLAAERVPDAIRDCAASGVRAAVVFATGFAEAGPAGAALQERLREAWRGTGMRLLGPNTAGVRSTAIGLFGEQGTNLATVGYRRGSIAMISQSGALGGYFGSTYIQRLGVGTRYFVDTGNEVDVDVADCIEHISRDEEVSAIAAIVESVRDGRKLAGAIRSAASRGRPVLFLKVGRTAAGVEAARSHTAAMASLTELLEAEVAAAGAFVTRDEIQLTDALLLHSTGCVPASRRIGIVTPSGGFGVLALDLASEIGLELPEVAAPESDVLRRAGLGALSNPLEVAALAAPGTELLEASLLHMGAQRNIDSVILWHPHRLLLAAEQDAHVAALERSRNASGKPHFHCGVAPAEVRTRLQERGLLSFDSPTRLLRAIAAVAPAAARPVAGRAPSEHRPDGDALPPAEARDRLRAAGIPVVETLRVRDAAEAVAAQARWGLPIVLKLESRRATHKTEGGLVRGPLSAPEIPDAFAALRSSDAARSDPDAAVVAQPFGSGVELALGAYFDPAFGPSVMIAHGGVFVEVLADAAFAAAPVDRERALEMISHLRIYPALAGARGHAADVEAAADALVALSRYVASSADRSMSVDVNPLIVRERGSGAVAVDARVVRARSAR
ncbi:MAG: acetate--CoA ligase family protein [Chloroflexota bacterium]|nr:acetate--CoA ligase family protein [Chloroflexota bacterium]